PSAAVSPEPNKPSSAASSNANPPAIATFDPRMIRRDRSALSARSSICASISEIWSVGASSAIEFEPVGGSGGSTQPTADRAERSWWVSLALTHPTLPSQRQIVVLLRRDLDLLVLQHRKRARDPPPRRMRHDDVVDVA